MKQEHAVLRRPGFSLSALADEAAARAMIEEKCRYEFIETIQKARMANRYEVVVDGPDGANIYYVDDEARVVMVEESTSCSISRKAGKTVLLQEQGQSVARPHAPADRTESAYRLR